MDRRDDEDIWPWLALGAALAVILLLTFALVDPPRVRSAEPEPTPDMTCWWYWSPDAGAYVYDEAACPGGPDPGYPTDPNRVQPSAAAAPSSSTPAMLPDTAVRR